MFVSSNICGSYSKFFLPRLYKSFNQETKLSQTEMDTHKKHIFLEFIVWASTKVISRPRFRSFTWRVGDTNLGPPGCSSRALPLSYIPARTQQGHSKDDNESELSDEEADVNN